MGKSKVDLEHIKVEWLVGNAVVAFVCALLMAQVWEPSDVKNVMPISYLTVPTLPRAVILDLVAFLADCAVSDLCRWMYSIRAPIETLVFDYHHSWPNSGFVLGCFDAIYEQSTDDSALISGWGEDCAEPVCLVTPWECHLEQYEPSGWEVQLKELDNGDCLLNPYEYIGQWPDSWWMLDYDSPFERVTVTERTEL